MIVAAGQQPGWKALRSMPFLGPVRVPQLLVIMRKPFRFRTKRNLWPYAGLALVKESSANQEFKNGKLQRSKKAPMTRGLNRNHNPLLKGRVQGRGRCGGVHAGPVTRLLRSLDRARSGQRPRRSGAGAQDRGSGTAVVEERRDLRRGKTDDAGDIALGSTTIVETVSHFEV